MDNSDIHPKAAVPLPYSTKHAVPKPYVNTKTVSPDPALNLTPLKVCKNPKLSKYVCVTNTKPTCKQTRKHAGSDQTKISAKSLPSFPPSPWCSPTGKPVVWSGYDHLIEERIHGTSECSKRECRKKHRRPTISESLPDKKHLDTNRDNKTKHLCTSQKHKMSKTEATKYQKPEFNSCLKLAQEFNKLQLTKSNVDQEIAQQMKSEFKRQEIAEKAAVQVNFPFEAQLYRDLISIDVEPEDIASKLQAEKEIKMKAAKPHPRPRDPEPDVMEFFTPSIYHECCIRHLEIPHRPRSPQTAPPDWAYRQYRRFIERGEPS